MRNNGTAMWSLALDSHFAPEAMYWKAVAHYKASNYHTVLGKVAEELSEHVPVERLGEQGDSVAALEKKQSRRRSRTGYGFRRRALEPSTRGQQEPQGGALFCLLMALRRTEMRRGPFVGIRQPMYVTAAMLWCSPLRH
jgi:hypothetical protein